MRKATTICRHCGTQRYIKARGICSWCWAKPGVLDKYPKTGGGRRERYDEHEPTEAEIEAIIAEQSKCLPDWWDREGSQVEC